MDNPEYTFQILEVFSKVRSKEIPRELEEYISYVARTGDPVFQWSLVKVLIKEKLQAVLGEFVETGAPVDVPPCPNVDLFDYEAMKEHVLKQLDAFVYPPFTIQRICELLAAPRKEYNRVDKYMRAIEKNVLVVSASDLSMKRALDADESVINGILLYDKVNDSLTTFTNHVFAAAANDELAKMDETDAVQRIIDESWEEPPAFKLNGSGASFEHELRQLVDKGDEDEAKSSEPSSSSSSSDENAEAFDENSAQPSLQLAESATVAFEATKEDAETSPEPANDTYEFKEEGASVELDLASDEVAEKATEVDAGGEFDCQSEEPSTTTLEMMAVPDAPAEPIADAFDEAADAQPESAASEASFEEYPVRAVVDSGWITYSAGDFRPNAEHADEDREADAEDGKVEAEEPSQPPAAETDVQPETSAEMETSQSAE